MYIQKITSQDTWPIRHAVMWPDKPIDHVRLPDDEQGLHFGCYDHGRLVSVISLFITGDEAQFRKFATCADFQGKGYGTALLQHIVNEAGLYGIRRLWCNARVSKSSFYERAGFRYTGNTFEKDGIAYVVMEQLLV
jgi:GNAT superfamily N-acetyltransferase